MHILRYFAAHNRQSQASHRQTPPVQHSQPLAHEHAAAQQRPSAQHKPVALADPEVNTDVVMPNVDAPVNARNRNNLDMVKTLGE